ncbi:GumC family protein [Peteryoungia ipomoeae]|nr:GumC family protein [Peteryoungia ipomoeae]
MAEFDPRTRSATAASPSSPDGTAAVSLRRYLAGSKGEAANLEPPRGRPLTMDDIEKRSHERFPWQRSEMEFPADGKPQPRTRTAQAHGSITSVTSPPPHAEEPAVLDLKFVVAAAWTYRTPILAIALVGALSGALLSATLPKTYSATSTLYFDPQTLAVQFGQSDSAPSPEILNGTIDSQTQIISSRRVLETVATNLKLMSDPEFGQGTAGSQAGDLNRVLAELSRRIQVSRQDGTYVFQVRVTTSEASKSSTIANALVAAYLDDSRSSAQSSSGSVNAGLTSQLPALREALVAAEEEVRAFTARNDLFAVDGAQIADKRLQSLDDLLVAAQRKIIEAKAQLDNVSKLDLNDVLAGDAAASRTLGDLRTQYAGLSANVSSLIERLGERHPQLQSAKASLSDVERQIGLELQRMVTGARGTYEVAKKEEADLLKELNVQKASQTTNASALIELGELQRKAKAAQDVYEAVLRRSEETAAEKSLYASNVRILSEAYPPERADGPGRRALMMAGVFGGGLLGLGLGVGAAVALALYRRLVRRN